MRNFGRAAVVGALALVGAGCWPVPGQNADRTSYNPFESGITTETVGDLQEQWRWAGTAGMTGPVTSQGGVHVVDECEITTLDPRTGSERWSAPIPRPDQVLCSDVPSDVASEPHVTAEGDQVITSLVVSLIRPPGFLEAQWTTRVFDVATGADEGTAPVDFVVGERGAQLGGYVEMSVGPATTEARVSVAQVDGTAPQRSFRVLVRGSAQPAPLAITLGTGTIFHAGRGILATEPGSGTLGEAVRAYSATESRPGCGPVSVPPVPGSYELECPLWVVPTDGRPTVPVLGAGRSTLYVRTTAGTLYALDAASGHVHWTATGLGNAGVPALADGTLYVPTGDGRVVTFDADGCGQPTCQPSSTYVTGTTGAVSTPAVAGTVLYATAGGSVHAFAAEGCGSPECPALWSAPGSGAPVVSGGRLYVRSASNTGLVAYGLG